jgi:transposase
VFEEPTMTKRRPPYPLEFRRQMVELVRAGRSPEELAQEFEPTAPSMRNWVGRAECDGDGLTTAERRELTEFRRENRQLISGSRGISSQTGADRLRLGIETGSLYTPPRR